MTIESFQGPTRYLSSMYPLEVPLETPDGALVSCVEIGYQAEKFLSLETRGQILASTNGFHAKFLAEQLQKSGEPIRSDWDDIKIDVMWWFQSQKFEKNPDLARRLIDTGDEEIYEGNRRDGFWGVAPIGSRNGLNWLGVILMNVRDNLAESADKK